MNRPLAHFEPSLELAFLPIAESMEENQNFLSMPHCLETLNMSVEYYHRIGYHPPWTGYFVQRGDLLVGSAGYKGPPRDGKIEISYGVFEPFQNQGIGALICRALTELALKSYPPVVVTARTLPENNFSSRILEKNGFRNMGIVIDPDDGPVWEWVYDKSPS